MMVQSYTLHTQNCQIDVHRRILQAVDMADNGFTHQIIVSCKCECTTNSHLIAKIGI